MTTDADRLFDLDEALGKIGRLAHRAWNDGSPSFDEVIEEVILTCSSLMDGTTDESLRSQVEAVLPDTWCPDLPFQERLRNLIEARRAWINWDATQQARIRTLEAKVKDFGDPPLAVDPDAVARLRLLLSRNPRSLVLRGTYIALLKGVFGFTHGPTVVEPAILCPRCDGEGARSFGAGPVPCQRCDGEGLRIAELEHEREWLRQVADNANSMMVYMPTPGSTPPPELWEALDRSLADHRNNGYENSDHPDDFTAPEWSAADD
jgi:hypothetical protein